MKLRDLTHYENIQYNLKSLPYYEQIIKSKANFYISGGYVVALLFASRKENLIIEPGFYDDIDFFFYKEDDYKILNDFFYKKTLEDPSKICCMSTTDRATTYHVLGENDFNYKIQLIQKEFGPPHTVFQNYDIVNCCVAYSFADNEIAYKPVALSRTLDKEIDIFSDYLLNEEHPDFVKNLVLFSFRLNKYSERYSLTLSNSLFNRLMKLLIKYKDLEISQEVTRIAGWYGNRTVSFTDKTNVWQFYKNILYKNNTYTDYLDKFYQSIDPGNSNSENPF